MGGMSKNSTIWSNEKSIELIQLYKNERVIWDSRCESYYDKKIKLKSWRKISKAIGEDVEEIRKKMNALLGSYRREKSREKRSLLETDSDANIYRSRWFAYDYFNFISEKNNPLDDSVDTTFTEELQEVYITSDDVSEESDQETQLQEDSTYLVSEATPAQATSSKGATRKRKGDSMSNEAVDIQEKRSKTTNDDTLTSYGIYITNVLNKFDCITVARVKHAINNIIYQAELGSYTNNAGPSTSNFSTTQIPFFLEPNPLSPTLNPASSLVPPPPPLPQIKPPSP